MSLPTDLIDNAIYKGIIRSIKVALKGNCHRAALILIYAGIDALANLNRPEGQEKVEVDDFITLADKYIKLDPKVTGDEFYSARCALLHTYGMESMRTKSGTRQIAYRYDDEHVPAKYVARLPPKLSKEMVLVSFEVLADAFFRGVEQFLKDLHTETAKDPVRKQTIEARLRKFLIAIPASELEKPKDPNP